MVILSLYTHTFVVIDIDGKDIFLLQELTSDGLVSLVKFKNKPDIFQGLESKNILHPPHTED